MRKLFILAMVALLLTAGSAFAGTHLRSTPNATFANGLLPSTTNNDDDCTIGTAPAATLLLPYFDVDFKSPQTTAQTTLFTIVNVTRLPQIAHCTVWTDWSFPVLDFNIFLTGYDVQAINLYDVIGRGVIAPNNGTTNTITPGSMSAANNANANFSGTAATSCSQLPGQIPAQILADVQTGLTTGAYSTCGSSKVGGVHNDAIGYVTIDVASTCSTTLPTTSSYFIGEILFDNVLTGDYEQINPNPATGNYAGGNPMVHIRAVPEGGPAGSVPGTNLPYTFYDRYTNFIVPRTVDRRQPLPSTFAARYIQGGTGAFNTNYKIWREGITGAAAACSQYINNASLAVSEMVRFDEHENPFTLNPNIIISPAPSSTPSTPETSAPSTSSTLFPVLNSPSGDVAGWMYLNLNNGGAAVYSAARPGFAVGTTSVGVRQSQNWVIVSMFAEGRYSVDFDATWLGNGCSPAPALSNVTPIGPAGGVLVCPAGVTCTPPGSYLGTNATP